MSLPTPDDFELHPYNVDDEDDDTTEEDPGGDCMFPEPGDAA